MKLLCNVSIVLALYFLSFRPIPVVQVSKVNLSAFIYRTVRITNHYSEQIVFFPKVCEYLQFVLWSSEQYLRSSYVSTCR